MSASRDKHLEMLKDNKITIILEHPSFNIREYCKARKIIGDPEQMLDEVVLLLQKHTLPELNAFAGRMDRDQSSKEREASKKKEVKKEFKHSSEQYMEEVQQDDAL